MSCAGAGAGPDIGAADGGARVFAVLARSVALATDFRGFGFAAGFGIVCSIAVTGFGAKAPENKVSDA